jgi:hypothetical protein
MLTRQPQLVLRIVSQDQLRCYGRTGLTDAPELHDVSDIAVWGVKHVS